MAEQSEEEAAGQSQRERKAQVARILGEFEAAVEERRREWAAASKQLLEENEARRRPFRLRREPLAERMRREREVQRLRHEYDLAILRLELERQTLERSIQNSTQDSHYERRTLIARPMDERAELYRMAAEERIRAFEEGDEHYARAYAELLRDVSAFIGADVAVSIYLADEEIHEQVEAAVEQWLATADLTVNTRDEPVIGSWFRRLRAGAKSVTGSPVAREALLTGLHVADTRLVQTQDAYVTATLLQNVGPVLQSLQPTKDAVVRAGALLIVKVDWVVQVHQLTAFQQAVLDHQPNLAASPVEILAKLDAQNPVIHETAIQPAARSDGGDEATATTAN